MMRSFLLFFSVALLTGCGNQKPVADTIYFGGPILTMEDSLPQAEALAVAGGEILFVGTKTEALKYQGSATKLVDLAGKALLPGFVDGHSHFYNATQLKSWANISSPPAGPVEDIPMLVAELEALKTRLNAKPGDWLVAYGLDPDQLKEKRWPTKQDLEKKLADYRVLLIHNSNHGGVVNQRLLDEFAITDTSVPPEGSIIFRLPGSREPSGGLMEHPFGHIFEAIPKPASDAEFQDDYLQYAQEIYAAHGITTAQEGFTSPEKYAALKKAAKSGKLYLDVVALLGGESAPGLKKLLENESINWGEYEGHLKPQGMKIVLDGSPQGKTAYMTKPYLVHVPGCGHSCTGAPNLPPDVFAEVALACYQKGIQLFTHCNGDATIDMVIAAHSAAEKALGKPLNDRRTTIIHSQFMREEQLDRYKEYGFVPSFFPAHAFYFGDTHVENLGRSRADFLSPMRSAQQRGIRFSNHTDFTVVPLNQLFITWAAASRTTRSGNILGKDQRISVQEALKAITIYSAYQHFEEDRKGSLKAGKMADLVILDRNPLAVPLAEVPNIQVVETVKNGKTVFVKK